MVHNRTIKNKSVPLLLSAMLVLMASSIPIKSMTYDERAHLTYGTKILQFRSDREGMYEDSKMPFSALNALAFLCAETIVGSSTEARLAICHFAGRSCTILSALVLGIFVFRWSRELYGNAPAFFSLFLYVFSPNIVAHGRLITTDLYAALMITISTYYFWKFIDYGGWKKAVQSATVLGISQLAKYTCIYLYPIFLTIAVVRFSDLILGLVAERNVRGLLNCLKVFLQYALVFLGISILIINIGFLFNKPCTPLNEYALRSNLFKTLQKIPFLDAVPVPVPYPYLEGLDMVKFHEETGVSSGNLYLLGKLDTKEEPFEGFKGYFFYATLFKEPIALQLITVLAIIAFVVNRKKHCPRKNESFLLLPALFFIVYFNFFFRIHIGIRFLLPVFPLLYVFCGNLFKDWEVFSARLKSLFVVLLTYLVISTLSYFPHYLSYFNEIVWDRKQAYRLLADSNIDWGQNEWYLRRYKQRNPETKVNPDLPTSGKIAVSVNHLVGVFSPEKYRWLRENFEPVDHIAYSYLLYEVSPEELKSALQKH